MPSQRGGGVGKALFARLGAVAQEKGCARMDWVVLNVSTHVCMQARSQLKVSAVEPAVNRLLQEEAGSQVHGRVDRDALRRRWNRKAQKLEVIVH